jgi:protein SCO1/2
MGRAFRAAFLLLSLAGCGGPHQEYKGSDISGADFGKRLSLTDHNGRAVTLETFRGKLLVLFFGYTHCPDVCPTTLQDMAQALKIVGPGVADKVQVLFATVDPERDTADTLKAYVPYFHAGFLGLRGTPAEIEAAAREFRVVFRKHVAPGASGYLVDHSAGSYVLDASGKLRLYLPYAHSPADIAHDLSLLAKAG